VAVGSEPEIAVVFIPGLPIRGLYAPQQQTIALRAGQTRRMRRSVLAEELAHHRLGHRPHPDHTETRRMEVRARRWAACRLVSLADLAAAMVGALSWAEVAERLEVDPALLESRLTCLGETELVELRDRLGGRESP